MSIGRALNFIQFMKFVVFEVNDRQQKRNEETDKVIPNLTKKKLSTIFNALPSCFCFFFTYAVSYSKH